MSVLKAYFPVRRYELHSFIQRRKEPAMEISGNSGLPFPMVPCLHQSDIHIKMKLRDLGAKKCNPCVGTKSVLPSTELETTRFHAAPYRAVNVNFKLFWATFPHGTMYAPKQ